MSDLKISKPTVVNLLLIAYRTNQPAAVIEFLTQHSGLEPVDVSLPQLLNETSQPERPRPKWVPLDKNVLDWCDVDVVSYKPRRKINAIKLYREATGLPLKESKDAVEAVLRRHGY